MGFTESGFFTVKNNQGKCLSNETGNAVDVMTCDPSSPFQRWYYDVEKKNLCQGRTKNIMGNCLQNGGSLTPDHKVGAYPNNDDATQQWIYNTVGESAGTLCNISTGQCIENGGPSSLGLSVAAYNDDKNINKKWQVSKAQCLTSKAVPSKIALTGTNYKNICGNLCEQNKGTFNNQYTPGLLTSKCMCNTYTACNL